MTHPTDSDIGLDCSERDRRKVGIADYEVTSSEDELVTYGLGSCVGVTLFDKRATVAGLIHIKRPSIDDQNNSQRATFADSGIKLLCQKMNEKGAAQRRLEAKIVGGFTTWEFTFSDSGGSIGDRNVEQATETLAELGIPIIAKDVGGDSSRSLFFDGGSGALTIKMESDECYMI